MNKPKLSILLKAYISRLRDDASKLDQHEWGKSRANEGRLIADDLEYLIARRELPPRTR